MNINDFFDRTDECYFVNDLDKVADYCKRNFADEALHVMRIADETCRGEFLFDLKWDMERTYEPVIFKNGIDWFYMPGDDPEFIFQFNRHRFFMCLGQAYAMTGDEKYAECYTALLMDWIEKSKLNNENKRTTWRTIEAGLRGEYWTRAFRYFKNSHYITEKVTDSFAKSLKEHAEFIIKEHSVLRRMSNWSILEDHGLFEIGCFLPQDDDTKRYIETALSHLELEVRLQILPDGAQWEQSPMYHNEVCHCLTDVLLLSEKNPEIINKPKLVSALATIKNAVKKMVYADAAWVKPDHHQFINGDSDDTDLRDILSLGAYIFDDAQLKYLGFEQLDFDNAWDLGYEGIVKYKDIKAKLPSFVSAALDASGNYYLRSDWSEEANLLHFHCGTIGAGHGHSDQLHFDLVVNGEDVLTDSGRFNYVAGPNRYEFKNPTAHNTTTVDDTFFTVCMDSWRCSKLSQPINQKHTFLPEYEFVQGGHLGYADMKNGTTVNRKIVHIKPDIYIVCDEFYTGGSHSYQQYYNFSEQGEVILTSGSENISELSLEPNKTETVYFDEKYVLKPCTKTFDNVKAGKAEYIGDKCTVKMYFIANELSTELTKSRISRNYNQAVNRNQIVNRFSAEGFCSAFTVICTQKKNEQKKVTIKKGQVDSVFNREIHPEYCAEALQITVDQREYVVIVCHREVNTPTDQTGAFGCMGFGNVLVFDKKREQQPGTVLLY